MRGWIYKLDRPAKPRKIQKRWRCTPHSGGAPFPAELLSGIFAMIDAGTEVSGPFEYAKHRWPDVPPKGMRDRALSELRMLAHYRAVEPVPDEEDPKAKISTQAYRLTRHARTLVDFDLPVTRTEKKPPKPRRKPNKTSTKRLLDLLGCLSREEWKGKPEICKTIGVSKSHAYQLLKALEQQGLIVSNGRTHGAKRWRLRPKPTPNPTRANLPGGKTAS